jgi:chromatin remodeling complex protein RSC6
VKDHNLQNPEHKREILIDDKLKKLLAPIDGEKVTYFSIQRLLKVHYVKNDNISVSTPEVNTSVSSKPSASKTTTKSKSKK